MVIWQSSDFDGDSQKHKSADHAGEEEFQASGDGFVVDVGAGQAMAVLELLDEIVSHDMLFHGWVWSLNHADNNPRGYCSVLSRFAVGPALLG
ncbi:hypothetical protein AXW37_06255 [Yersinia ruckeri]|nr:hypothetical protein AXW19_05870 [Yersinia ruckeri]OIX35426.1 hypothetical protein AXW20_05865 [Yersinia ruckeri]OIX35712.1 hypothetical protein AXW18_05875 [Yersinia ruckeri]OIX43004.1 hypothetical protein AXW21_05865 [Yersinia ruckeri]OIX43207.1 hypothetical protein AXW23_05850 [Yersinia ruckeri]